MYKVAIIGRPNVGKSTLFNRLTNKKRSITDPTSGVTRDVICEECNFANHKVLLYDTGGIKDSEDKIDVQVRERSIKLLGQSDVVIFVADGKEWTGEDDEMIELVRPFSDKVIFAVNKIDDVVHDDLIWNYYQYGFPRVLAISSSHGRGLGELEEWVASLLEEKDLFLQNGIEKDVEKDEEESEKNTINISIMGKPNSGKSTLMNELCREDLCIVSDIAGTTRDTVKGNFTYKDYNFNLVDTAGIRRKSKVEGDIEYYSVNRAIKSIEDADVVILMIDVNVGITDQDKKIADLITRRGCGVVLTLNKIDTLTVKNQLEAIKDRVRFLFPLLSFAPLVSISAKDGENTRKLLDTCIMVKKEMEKRVNTAALNAALKKWNEIFTPPRSAKGYYKVLYATQVDESPVRFLLFVNKKKGFPESYISFIKNRLRTEFGFSHICINIHIRERERTDDRVKDDSMRNREKRKNAKK